LAINRVFINSAVTTRKFNEGELHEKPRYSDSQILAIIKQAETGVPVPELRWSTE